jgi:hypothetical protein
MPGTARPVVIRQVVTRPGVIRPGVTTACIVTPVWDVQALRVRGLVLAVVWLIGEVSAHAERADAGESAWWWL